MIKLFAMLIAYKWAMNRVRDIQQRHPDIDDVQCFRSCYDGMYRWLTEPIYGKAEIVVVKADTEELVRNYAKKGEGE